MKASLITKLQGLQERCQEITALLSDPSVIADQSNFRALSREYAQLTAVTDCFAQWQQVQAHLANTQILLQDIELRELAQQEVEQYKQQLEQLELQLQHHLLPKDPEDDGHCFLEIRAGAGGDEAAIFAGDLLRLYSRYAELRGWKLEVISHSVSEQGGFKEVISKVMGHGAYGALKFESGGHRVQRVPVTESQGRVHTSTCTVGVMPEVPEQEVQQLNPADLRVDTFRASGAGGQHINRTDSAVRITHLPTGTVAECQDERSQHKNRAKAMAVLAARLRAAAEAVQQQESAALRRRLLGSGERSDRIRTYNFAQNRITDHRINLTLYQLSELLEGQLNLLIQPLLQEDQADRLASLADQ